MRKIENAKKISEVIASAKNNFLLDSNNLNLSLATSLTKNWFIVLLNIQILFITNKIITSIYEIIR